MLLVQSIQITDKFGFDRQQQSKSSFDHFDEHNESVFISSETMQGFCVNAIGKCVLLYFLILTIWFHIIELFLFCGFSFHLVVADCSLLNLLNDFSRYPLIMIIIAGGLCEFCNQKSPQKVEERGSPLIMIVIVKL